MIINGAWSFKNIFTKLAKFGLIFYLSTFWKIPKVETHFSEKPNFWVFAESLVDIFRFFTENWYFQENPKNIEFFKVFEILPKNVPTFKSSEARCENVQVTFVSQDYCVFVIKLWRTNAVLELEK